MAPMKVKASRFAKNTAGGGTFEIFTGKAGKIWFRLKASNSEIILHSQGYKAVDGCTTGIESVKNHCGDPKNFEKLESKSGQPYFVLKARNHEVIGTSQMYKSASSRDHGIKSVARWATKSTTVNLTEKSEKEEKQTAGFKRPAAAAGEEPPLKKKPAAAAETEKDIQSARAKELKAMLVADLKELALSLDLEKSTKEAMLESVIKFEAKKREAERAMESKRDHVLVDKKKELETKDVAALKELCEKRGLKTGGSKGDKIERILADIKAKGEVDAILAGMARAERKEELGQMTKEDLQKMCSKAKIDPIVKEVMVERILVHEAGYLGASV